MPTSELEISEGKSSIGSKFVRMLMIILDPLLVSGAGVFYLYTTMTPEDVAVSSTIEALNLPSSQQITGEIIPLETFIVNLADPGTSKFLKVTLVLEVSGSRKVAAEVSSNTPKIRDIIITVLSSRTYDEIRTERGQTIFKNDIRTRINAFLQEGSVINIYKSEFIAQGM